MAPLAWLGRDAAFASHRATTTTGDGFRCASADGAASSANASCARRHTCGEAPLRALRDIPGRPARNLLAQGRHRRLQHHRRPEQTTCCTAAFFASPRRDGGGWLKRVGHSRQPASCRRVARAYVSATMPPRPAAEAPRWHMMHVSPSSSGSMPASAAGLADDPALPSAVGRADAPPPCGEDALAPAPCTACPRPRAGRLDLLCERRCERRSSLRASPSALRARACRCRRAFSSGMIPQQTR